MANAQVRIDDRRGVTERSVAIPHVTIAGTTSGTATAVYTVRAERASIEVRKFTAVNTTASAATLTVHTIPDGGTIGAGNTEISALSIAGNTAVDLTDLMGGFYTEGVAFAAYSDTASAIVVHGWGREVL